MNHKDPQGTIHCTYSICTPFHLACRKKLANWSSDRLPIPSDLANTDQRAIWLLQAFRNIVILSHYIEVKQESLKQKGEIWRLWSEGSFQFPIGLEPWNNWKCIWKSLPVLQKNEFALRGETGWNSSQVHPLFAGHVALHFRGFVTALFLFLHTFPTSCGCASVTEMAASWHPPTAKASQKPE